MSILLALLLASVPGAPGGMEWKAKVCPPGDVRTLDADEKRILTALAGHYRQHQWSSEEARRSGTFVYGEYARHSVPLLAAPQVYVQRTYAFTKGLENGLRIELQRHLVDPQLAAQLIDRLDSRNDRT